MRRRWWWLVAAAMLAACGAREIYHHVRAGETLARIARAYDVPYEDIADANDLDDPSRIIVGQRLLIPGADRELKLPPLAGVALAPVDRAHGKGRPRDAPSLGWPAAGPVTSAFGRRAGNDHDGIDISAPVGAAVRAAAAGEVVYGGTLPGYGNVMIVRHASGYVTVYAHNDKHHVAEGVRVRRGQLIASVGRTGRTTGANLHFEVRKDNVAYDPLLFRPARAQRAETAP